MKRLIPIFILSLFVASASAQEDNHVMCISLPDGQVVKYEVSKIEKMWFEVQSAPQFPEADNSKELNVNTPAHSVRDLLNAVGTECTGDFGYIRIEDSEYAEIKTFTDNLVSGIEKQYDIYVKCYDWVRNNVKYGEQYDDGSYVNNDPYPVFQTKRGVCQGYSNLLFIMLHSQGVPAMVVNGMCIQYGKSYGHAWNYVNCNGDWYVSDPTNSFHFEMSNIDQYASGNIKWHPMSMNSVVLFKETDFWYNFAEYRLNVCRIESQSEVVTVPYSVNGFKISLLNPDYVSANVKELYLGENIESFADMANGYPVGLRNNAKSLEAINIAPENKNFSSHKGVVYSKDGKNILIVPSAIKKMELLPLNFGKDGNAIENLKEVEEIYFPEGTGDLDMYAVSDCPKLKVAYIPEGVNVNKYAFYNVHKDFKIVTY